MSARAQAKHAVPQPEGPKGKKGGILIFYVVFIAAWFVEGALNRGLLYVATKLHVNPPMFAWVMFVVGGSLLAFLTLWRTSVEQALRDPILRFAQWLWHRLGWFGFVLDAVLVAALGVAIVLKADNRRYRPFWSVVAAVIFATVWVPTYTFLWH